jgi:hypothetical protein
MRGSPSCAIAVRRFAVWRFVVAVVTLLSLASLIAWIGLSPAAQFISPRVAAALMCLAAVALAASLLRSQPVELRWDGSSWSCRDLAAPLAAPVSGELEVAVDLGSFLLVRFISPATRGQRRVCWIPVERRRLEREWHSFRCAVYSPRPAAGTAGDAASPHP